jgi:glucokinase
VTRLLGIDYGGTQTKLLLAEAGAAGGTGAAVRRHTVPTATLSDLDRLAHAAEDFVAGERVDGFGVTVAGTLDATGTVGRSANMPWLDGQAPADVLGDRLGVAGVAVQDGVAAALAEARAGAGRGHDDIFVIALGTGIAGAHVVRGEVRRGAHGGAGEIGHMAVAGDLLCSCGQRGCLETAIGGSQLGRRWNELRGASDSHASAADVVAAARQGDAHAIRALDLATSALGRALLELSALIDPAVVVIGGGVARSPEWTVDPAVAKARAGATFHRVPDVVPAELGVWAGAQGAALAADQLVRAV